MNTKSLAPLRLAAAFLILAVLACSFLQAATVVPTVQPTNSPTSLPPTATSVPTATPPPTETPDLAATKTAAGLQARIQGYVKNGYLASDQGSFVQLQDSTDSFAKKNYLRYSSAGYDSQVKNFAVWAHVGLTSASPVNYPEYSGCGFTFRVNDAGDAYTLMVIKDRVLMTACRNNTCKEVGKTRGSGRLGYQGDFEASVDLIVNDTDARVLVDNQLIGEYTLSSDYLTDPGYLGYSIISGTNKDYGTRCTYNNAGLWIP